MLKNIPYHILQSQPHRCNPGRQYRHQSNDHYKRVGVFQSEKHESDSERLPFKEKNLHKETDRNHTGTTTTTGTFKKKINKRRKRKKQNKTKEKQRRRRRRKKKHLPDITFLVETASRRFDNHILNIDRQTQARILRIHHFSLTVTLVLTGDARALLVVELKAESAATARLRTAIAATRIGAAGQEARATAVRRHGLIRAEALWMRADLHGAVHTRQAGVKRVRSLP